MRPDPSNVCLSPRRHSAAGCRTVEVLCTKPDRPSLGPRLSSFPGSKLGGHVRATTSPYSLTYPEARTSTEHEILLIDGEPRATAFVAALRQIGRVLVTSSVQVAGQYIARSTPSLVIADANLIGAQAAGFCRTAKTKASAPTVLMTVQDVQSVPPLLKAGCDAVLLEPFAPNLLYARVGRLLRTRAERRLARADRDEGPLATTNQHLPDRPCPTCGHLGVVSFEFDSHRRAWYACLECDGVWLARRQD